MRMLHVKDHIHSTEASFIKSFQNRGENLNMNIQRLSYEKKDLHSQPFYGYLNESFRRLFHWQNDTTRSNRLTFTTKCEKEQAIGWAKSISLEAFSFVLHTGASFR